MKAILLSIGVIFLLFAIVITNAIYINLLLGSLEKGLEAANDAQDYKGIYDTFNRHERLLSLTLDDERLLGIEIGLLDCVGYTQTGRLEDLSIEKSRLLSTLGQTKRLSGFDINAII